MAAQNRHSNVAIVRRQKSFIVFLHSPFRGPVTKMGHEFLCRTLPYPAADWRAGLTGTCFRAAMREHTKLHPVEQPARLRGGSANCTCAAHRPTDGLKERLGGGLVGRKT